MDPVKLWHFTCAHGARAIGRYGLVLPQDHFILAARLAWFTDAPELDPTSLGLTSHFIQCNRMQFCYEVLDAAICEPFLQWAKRTGNLFAGKLLDPARRPEHWFIAERAVRVRQVRDYVARFTI